MEMKEDFLFFVFFFLISKDGYVYISTKEDHLYQSNDRDELIEKKLINKQNKQNKRFS